MPELESSKPLQAGHTRQRDPRRHKCQSLVPGVQKALEKLLASTGVSLVYLDSPSDPLKIVGHYPKERGRDPIFESS